MSTTLTWYPPPTERNGVSIGSLKYILAEKFGRYDGSMGENLGTFGPELIPLLEGISIGNGAGDMGRDARNLIEAIKKHGKVELTIE